MKILGIILWVVANAPTVVKLANDLINIIKNKPQADQETAKQELRDAVATGDVSVVSKALHKHCSGVACPAEVVTDEN